MLVSVKVIEYLVGKYPEDALLERARQAAVADKKSIEVGTPSELAQLVNEAWIHYADTKGYVKGQCNTLKYDGLNALCKLLKLEVAKTALWKRCGSELMACLAEPITYTPEGIAKPTAYELATEFVQSASQAEFQELRAVTGLAVSHHEVLVHLLLEPAHAG